MSPKGQIVGYVRVSSADQNIDWQVEQLAADRLFVDRVTGKDLERPELAKLLGYVREGDTIVVASMDRLARNVDDLRRLVAEQTQRGVGVRFIKENLTFTGKDSPMADMLLGIKIARQKGKYRGRRKSLSDDQILEAHKRINAGEKKSDVAKAFGISRDTLYRSLKRPTACL